MISYEQALKSILINTPILPAELVLIEDSFGRILRENIYAGIDMPPFDKSAMDGYAIRAADSKDAPVELRCIGLIQAGQDFKKKLNPGECVKIMTGAPMPKNSDSVVMIENTRQSGDWVGVLEPVKKGENVCLKGQDIRNKEQVLKKEKKITSSEVAVIATLGKRYVKATKEPLVAIINTGGEIIQPGRLLGRSKIYNSNGPMLQALLKSEGIEPFFLGIAKDNIKDLKSSIKEGLKKDMLLISGGVSMGDYDLVPEVLASLGVEKIFHKVNIKPGKPLFFGIKNKTLVFGIPGNPVSNFLSYLIFVRPALCKMKGYLNCKPAFKEGLVEKRFYTKAGRKHFVLVKISRKLGRYYVSAVDSHGSADTLALSKADGFMVVDERLNFVRKGSKIQFITWKIQ